MKDIFEVAPRPIAGIETCEFTSQVERGRVPPFINERCDERVIERIS